MSDLQLGGAGGGAGGNAYGESGGDSDAPDYSAIYDWVRDLLNSDETRLPDSRLQKYADSSVNLMIDLYPDLGDYAGLDGTNKSFFDEGVGHLVAIRLRPASSKSVPVGDLVRVHTMNTHFQYADTLKAGGETLESQWMMAANRAFARVAAIKVVLSARGSSFSPFRISGPTRAARANGQHESLLSGLIRLLSEDAADTLESDDAAAWTL